MKQKTVFYRIWNASVPDGVRSITAEVPGLSLVQLPLDRGEKWSARNRDSVSVSPIYAVEFLTDQSGTQRARILPLSPDTGLIMIHRAVRNAMPV